MSEFRALKGFAGLISMRKGDVKEISDEALVNDLLRAGYIEPVTVEAEAEAVESEPVETTEAAAEVNESEAVESEAVESEAKPRARRGRGAKKEA